METAKVFENDRGQEVILPNKYRLDTDNVIIQRLGKAIILVPENMVWETFMNGINSFSEDFFQDGREKGYTDRNNGYADCSSCES